MLYNIPKCLYISEKSRTFVVEKEERITHKIKAL